MAMVVMRNLMTGVFTQDNKLICGLQQSSEFHISMQCRFVAFKLDRHLLIYL